MPVISGRFSETIRLVALYTKLGKGAVSSTLSQRALQCISTVALFTSIPSGVAFPQLAPSREAVQMSGGPSAIDPSKKICVPSGEMKGYEILPENEIGASSSSAHAPFTHRKRRMAVW